ncbi:MAG TPA: SDR family oxidoreductase [Gammaproteobacteria bacterium]|nr:SDR family oxidoreductase [Gammaproteobacteria bacterium]
MKTVIISGGSSGIGWATLECFAQADYFCFILDKKPPEKIHPTAQFLECDLTQVDQIYACVNALVKTHATIDALVCNAGVHFSASLLDTDEHAFDHIMNTNFRSAFFLTQAVLPHMIAQKKGAILFVGSDQSLVARPHSAIYGASKAALASLARTTAIDYAQVGIRSNVVAVGTVETPLYQKAIARYCERMGASLEAVHALEGQEQPIGRVGQPDEIAELIYFLCSDAASYITGGIYPIDGGYTAR